VANDYSRIARWYREAAGQFEQFTLEQRRFVAAVKSTLVAADVAGSALPKAAPDVTERAVWVAKAFDSKPRLGDYEAIVRCRLQGKMPFSFQEAVAASAGKVTYVKAGCGRGKTLAAYLWAARQHAPRRLYFCYPTAGTATEGYRDYLHALEGEATESDARRVRAIKARLFHSRADIDFEIILKTGQDEERSAADAAARVESLEAWSTPVVSCTVNTVLGLVQNNKRALFAWPALAQSALVFDEINAYDDRLFGALLQFLQAVPCVPVLLMTTSLPRAREAALRQLMKRMGHEMSVITGPVELEGRPRYCKRAGDPFDAVRTELENGGKVLWVSNTVCRVLEVADRLKDLKLAPLIYHSRFKYEDRVKRHDGVVEAFKPEKNRGPVMACCSQVAEISLDLRDCTLLVTDLAPVPALIQRLGRLNRDAGEGAPTRPFLVVAERTQTFPLDTHLPYTPADLEAARAWLDKLPAEGISQRTLSEAWEQFDTAHRPEFVANAWLGGGPSTTVLELRDASPGITVLMEEDAPAVRGGKELARVVLPMPPVPRHLKWRDWPELKGIPVAPPRTVIYDSNRGAEWRRLR
jgi:CRISPR-associated endonuclease/helicase Cas3